MEVSVAAWLILETSNTHYIRFTAVSQNSVGDQTKGTAGGLSYTTRNSPSVAWQHFICRFSSFLLLRLSLKSWTEKMCPHLFFFICIHWMCTIRPVTVTLKLHVLVECSLSLLSQSFVFICCLDKVGGGRLWLWVECFLILSENIVFFASTLKTHFPVSESHSFTKKKKKKQ